MLVTRDGFFNDLQKVCDASLVALDTETYGLKAYKDDGLFAIIAATPGDVYYFNFHPEHPEPLPRTYIRHFSRVFLNVLRTVYFANAKFDMAMLARDGVSGFQCRIHDVLAVQRLIKSDAVSWNLKTTAKFFGLEKLDVVEDYIKEHKLWEWVQVPGKRTREKNKFFSKVPFEIIQPYAERDAQITLEIGRQQQARWDVERSTWGPTLQAMRDPLEIENQTTKACFKLESRGVLIDQKLCAAKSSEHELEYSRAKREFHDLTGVMLVDSAKVLAPVFTNMGYVLPRTDTGRESITDQWLHKNDTRISQAVRRFRENTKLANTYYKAFLWHQDKNAVIHASIRQGGTKTGRFSYGVPNLQNVPKDGDVRKAFIPRPGYAFVSIDFDQQEYRLCLDYAGETEVISRVLGGMDVHNATAEMMGKSRQEAKTLNFLLLYGGGVVKLASSLYPELADFDETTLWAVFWHWIDKPEKAEVEFTPEAQQIILPFLEKAKALRELYFERLPKVSQFISNVKLAAERNRKIRTWTGRPIHFPQKAFCYKAPNALIQGGCSDVGKLALIELDRFLEGRLSKPIILVHDEVLFEVHESELDLVPDLKRIMEQIYPHRRMPLTCSVAHSFKSWGDLVDGAPGGETTRDEVQREGAQRADPASGVVHQDARGGAPGHA